MQAGMTKCEEERWTPSLQSLKAILARTQLLNDSRPPCTHHRLLLPFDFRLHLQLSAPLPSHLTLALAAMTGPSIISPNWSLLIAVAVNYLDFAEITR